MRFRNYLQIKEIEDALLGMGLDHRSYDIRAISESPISASLRRGLLAGGVLALAPFLAGRSGSDEAPPSRSPAAVKVSRDQELVDDLKDTNQYWGSEKMKELAAAANAGDEWAVREIAWPKGHRFHKKGRPFFKNDKPHPKGLFPHSGH